MSFQSQVLKFGHGEHLEALFLNVRPPTEQLSSLGGQKGVPVRSPQVLRKKKGGPSSWLNSALLITLSCQDTAT